MNKLKIAVYAICKNEEHFVDRWLESMKEADEIYVTDTGSDDSTSQKLIKGGAIVNHVKLGFWRFDTARNISLSFVPLDVDVCVCTDLDEILEPGWRNYIEEVWEKNITTRLRYKYTWSFNPDGTPGVTFLYEKIHCRQNFRWIHPVHEILQYYGEKPDSYAFNENIQLNHFPDPSKSRGQYLELLELSVKESPDDDRSTHYLGREYMYYGMWDKCINTLKKHLEMPKAVWKDERCASMRYIAGAFEAKGDIIEADNWMYKAIGEAPYLREPYIEAAKLAYSQNNWEKTYFMIIEALKIKERNGTYISESYCWDYTPYDLGAIAAYNLGLKKEAVKLAEKAVSLNPTDKRLINNLKIISDN